MAVLRGEGAEGDVVHIRLPCELHKALRQVAAVNGRPITQEIVFRLDAALFGSRELRLLKGELGEH